MKRSAFFTAAIIGLSALTASAADTNVVLNGWLAAQTKLQTWSADFVQTRTMKTLTRPLTATGHISFSAPEQFRWEIRSPGQTIALRDTEQMYVIYPQLKRAERYPLGAKTPEQWRDALSLLQAGFPHDRKDLDSRFDILGLTETNGAWQLDLQPTSAFARQMIRSIGVGLATNNYSLVNTELVFIDGSTMRNDFTNAVWNPKLDAALFQWTPPADFKVTEPFSK